MFEVNHKNSIMLTILL